jgi:hypothetical protein
MQAIIDASFLDASFIHLAFEMATGLSSLRANIIWVSTHFWDYTP